MTVMTLGQTIWREAEGGGCELMSENPVAARNVSENACRGKRRGPQKAHRVL
jgi:hypothetical protein